MIAGAEEVVVDLFSRGRRGLAERVAGAFAAPAAEACPRGQGEDDDKERTRTVQAVPLEMLVEDAAIRPLENSRSAPGRTRGAAAEAAERAIGEGERQLAEFHGALPGHHRLRRIEVRESELA